MINEEKFKRGEEAQKEFWGSTIRERRGQRISSLSNGIGELYRDHTRKMITEHLFGDVWYRPGLSQQEKTVLLITVSSTVVFDYDAVLRSRAGLFANIEGAIYQGMSKEEILEVIMEIAHYSGWCAGYNALIVAKEVFSSVNIPTESVSNDKEDTGTGSTDSADRKEQGRQILRQLQGGTESADFSAELFPDFWNMTLEHLFGGVWARPGLSLRKRIIISLAANMTLKFNFGLKESLRWAVNNGFSREEIQDAIIEVAHLRGWPAGINAIRVAREVCASKA